MKKIILSVAIAVGAITATYAQDVHPCHTDEKTAEFVSSLSPQEQTQYHIDKQAYEQEIQNYIQNHPEAMTNSGARAIQYTIPVVFHIIHAGGDENISNEQVEDCIRILNEDFQKLNNDWDNVESEFLSIVADAEIEFKLAKRDPQGNCTNGITRTYSNVTFTGDGGDRVSVVQNEHGNWPGDEYMNVFVAAEIGGAAGYTYTPSNWIGAGMSNGIHVLHNYVGSIGTSSTGTSRTMTHEAGHWLNLSHLWGSTNNPGVTSNCNDDDGVNDTPNTIGWQSCNLSGTTCDGQKDNVENFLEYSFCSKMFTLGQKARMQAALESSTAGRNNLNTTANLTATGVNEPDIMCKAQFEASQRTICPGQSISFEDYSFHGPTGWTWNFPGGTPSSSTDQNPTVTYNTPGVYQVELTATDGNNSDTETKTGYITVLDQSASLPFIEGFESYNNLSTSPWIVKNNDNNAEFALENGVGYTGTKSVKLANFGQPSGTIDELISSPVDLSSITNEVTLSFRYAYRKRSSSNEEWLRVFISNDCGSIWAQRKTLKGDNLGSETASSSWEPSTQDDWTTVHMSNVTSSYWVDNFRVKFQFEADNGNNFFLDDINIYQGDESNDPLSVEENSLINDFAVFPNPASTEANIKFSVDNNQNAKVELINMVGQTVKSTVVQAQTGQNLVVMPTTDLEAGIYMVKVSVNGAQQVQRLMIK
tara:strand:+ start:105686 stop:107794 length:2109 start_codon:yes stop_codon:yes gene_type:complete